MAVCTPLRAHVIISGYANMHLSDLLSHDVCRTCLHCRQTPNDRASLLTAFAYELQYGIFGINGASTDYLPGEV